MGRSVRYETDLRFPSVPVPLAYEKFYQPDVIRVFDELVKTLSF